VNGHVTELTLNLTIYIFSHLGLYFIGVRYPVFQVSIQCSTILTSGFQTWLQQFICYCDSSKCMGHHCVDVDE